jgi:hypothetical protein
MLESKLLLDRIMERIIKYLILILLISFVASCSPTREASTKDRASMMLLKPEEFARNKPYKRSKKTLKIHKKAKKSLLKRSYKIK